MLPRHSVFLPTSLLWEESTMKRLSGIVTGLIVIALGLGGCATGGGSGGWVALFDGSNLKHWYDIGNGNWRVEGGVLVADGKKGKDNAFLLTNEFYKDFQLRAEFWVSDDANSGIYFRCGNPEVINDKVCYEANIFDQRKDPSYGTGALVHIAKVDPMPKAGGKWNTFDITVKGDRVTVVLNGARTAEVQDTQFASGPLALQYGSGVIKFRKVQIRPL